MTRAQDNGNIKQQPIAHKHLWKENTTFRKSIPAQRSPGIRVVENGAEDKLDAGLIETMLALVPHGLERQDELRVFGTMVALPQSVSWPWRWLFARLLRGATR